MYLITMSWDHDSAVVNNKANLPVTPALGDFTTLKSVRAKLTYQRADMGDLTTVPSVQ